MAETQRRTINQETEEKKGRSRWVASAEAKAERLAHWQLVDSLYQAKHWTGARASWRPDPVLNYTFHVTEEHRAQLAQLQPEPVFKPRRPTDDKTTNTLREVAKYGWQRAQVPYWMDLGNLAMLLHGKAIYHVFWDPTLEGGSPDPVDLVGPDGRPLFQAAGTLFKGDWKVRTVDPAHFFLDPGLAGPDLQEAAWCGVGELQLLSALGQRYKLPPDITPIQPDVLQQGYVRATTTYTRAPEGDGYGYCFEAYEKFPADQAHKAAGYKSNVRKLVFVNWRLIDVQDYYVRHSLYPFVGQDNYTLPGQFWSMGDPQQYIALERLVRKLYELVALSALLGGMPQKIAHPLSGLSASQVTNEPNKVYTPGPAWGDRPVEHALKVLEMGQVPPYVMNFLEMVKSDIQTITGLFTGLPPGVSAASAVIAVFERLAARLKKKAMNVGYAARGILEQAIGLMTENYAEDRVFRLTQPIDGVPWTTFRGSDYAGLELDIDVDFAATAPLSKAVLAEQSGAAYKSGALRASEYLTVIDFPYPDIIEQVKQREQQADDQQRAAQQATQAAQAAQRNAGVLPPGINLEGATPSAKTLVTNNLAQAGRV